MNITLTPAQYHALLTLPIDIPIDTRDEAVDLRNLPAYLSALESIIGKNTVNDCLATGEPIYIHVAPPEPILDPDAIRSPLCPKCRLNDLMRLNLSTLHYSCSRCVRTWSNNYLTGWNEGFNAANGQTQQPHRA